MDFDFPLHLVAMQPHRPSRVLYAQKAKTFQELTISSVLQKFQKGDVLILNNSKVEKREVRGYICGGQDIDILFVHSQSEDMKTWQVLCLARQIKDQKVLLPENVVFQLLDRGRPQMGYTSKPLQPAYFERYGHMPLPPYIQKQRKKLKIQQFKDEAWYQNPYGKIKGSSASPTASLHFTDADLIYLRQKGVKIIEVTLHIGFATYLPLENHQKIHSEWCCVPKEAVDIMDEALRSGHRVVALGTTSVRAIESMACGLLTETERGFEGETHLMIRPGHIFRWINGLLTNFHRPRSSLLELVMAFAGRDQVMAGYKWAIQRKFYLFSYGDLSMWDHI